MTQRRASEHMGWDDKSWQDVNEAVGQALQLVLRLDERLGGGGGGIGPDEVLERLQTIKDRIEFAEMAAQWAAP